MRILIAEDDASVAAALASALGRAGHGCLSVARGSDVLLRHREAELVLLDLGLEDMDGLDALRQLREVSTVPVIVVTARSDERATVRALRLGADDYVVKPVRLHELLARVEAVARRHVVVIEDDALDVGPLRIERGARRALRAGTDLALTPNEFALLVALARRAGEAVSRQQLLDEVWGDAYAAKSRSLDVHMGQLRQKLAPLVISTIRGFGYRLESTP